MNKADTREQNFEREIERALASLDEKDHVLFLAKLALKLGHQLESPSAIAEAITEARQELDG
tara:strand:+ start:6692 stop:6877 length:186 start_codon:yes stop_codon:yes gene_type:complete